MGTATAGDRDDVVMIMRSFSKVDSDLTILTTEVTTINLNCNR